MTTPSNDQTQPAPRRRLRDDISTAVLAYAGLGSASPTEPQTFLDLIDATRVAIDECTALQRTAVHQARRADNSWAAIGELLGISRQAAQQRFAPDTGEPGAVSDTKRIYGATAFNEMRLLETEGAAGYHLIDFGGLHLTLRASGQRWEHKRETALDIDSRRLQLEAEGWIFVGRWFPFHYFKRPLA